MIEFHGYIVILFSILIAILCGKLYLDLRYTRILYSNIVETYNECVINRNKIRELYRSKCLEFDHVLDKYDHALETLFKVEDKIRQLKNIEPEFTLDELKRIRYAIHPDRNGGKNSELFIKVNNKLN